VKVGVHILAILAELNLLVPTRHAQRIMSALFAAEQPLHRVGPRAAIRATINSLPARSDICHPGTIRAMVALGRFFHALGGFAAGSLYLPLKRIREWTWETGWIVGGAFSRLFVQASLRLGHE